MSGLNTTDNCINGCFKLSSTNNFGLWLLTNNFELLLPLIHVEFNDGDLRSNKYIILVWNLYSVGSPVKGVKYHSFHGRMIFSVEITFFRLENKGILSTYIIVIHGYLIRSEGLTEECY